MKYDDLDAVVAESDGLSESLVEFVLLNSGEPVTADFENQLVNRGDVVQHIPNSIARLKNRQLI